jgi:hypothetical protein
MHGWEATAMMQRQNKHVPSIPTQRPRHLTPGRTSYLGKFYCYLIRSTICDVLLCVVSSLLVYTRIILPPFEKGARFSESIFQLRATVVHGYLLTIFNRACRWISWDMRIFIFRNISWDMRVFIVTNIVQRLMLVNTRTLLWTHTQPRACGWVSREMMIFIFYKHGTKASW